MMFRNPKTILRWEVTVTVKNQEQFVLNTPTQDIETPLSFAIE